MTTRTPIAASSPTSGQDFVLVVDLRGASAGVDYRPWAEDLGDRSLLRWCCDRLSPAVPSLALLCDPRDEALIAAQMEGAEDRFHVTAVPAGTSPCNTYRAALHQAAAQSVVATVLAAAVLPPSIWTRVARRHAALGNRVTCLIGLPAGCWANMFDAAVLDALDQLVPDHLWIDPNITLQSIVASSGTSKTPVPDQFRGSFYMVPDDPAILNSQMPDRLTLDTPSDVESLRLALSANGDADTCLLARFCEARKVTCDRALQSLFHTRGVNHTGNGNLHRILYASIPSGFSGAEQSLCSTISAVTALGRWQPFALIGRQGLLSRRISDLGVPVITAKTRLDEAGVESLAEVASILQSCSPDLVHFNSVESWSVLYPVLARSIPIVQHLRIAEFASLARQMQAASVLVCVSQFVADCAGQCAVSPDRIHVVYNSVDLSYFSCSRESRERARRALGLTEDTFSVGILARYAPNKRHDLVVAAASMIPPSRRIRFFFVGEPFEHASCLREIQRMIRLQELESRITCIGFQADIRRVLFALDALVSASERDPLPRCVIEAMASGVPVVASRSGGHLELVQHGDTGLLFEQGDPTALAGAIQTLESDPAAGRSLAARAREFVADVLKPDAHVKRIDSIYRSVLH